MSKLLIQDDIIPGLDVYVEYTFDTDETVILYDYGIELTNETVLAHNDEPHRSIIHASLRGFKETAWMPEKLEEYIISEHTVEPYL